MQYIIGAYSQLPAGSSVEEYETLLTQQLRPLLTMIYRNSNYKLLFRLSISEFEYIEQNHPEVNMLINDLCKKGKMELLTSSYYDVVLSLIPTHERTSQIEKTTTYIRKNFSKKPKGFWFYNQVFNPSCIPIINLLGLNYTVISTYNQLTNHTESTRPFYTEELGKQMLVIPTDDKFSKETSELYKKNINLDKYLENMKKLAKDASNALCTVMLNLDQLMSTEGSVDVFNVLYESFGPNCTLPNIYTQENEISRTHYLPNGLYGRDYSIGKAGSINQLILDSPILSRNYGLVNMLRDVVRDSKKLIDERKNIENLLMKASSSSLYFPDECKTPSVRRHVNRYCCELETMLSKILPEEFDIDFDRVEDFIIEGKSHIAYLRKKGGSLSRFVVTSSLTDLLFHSGDGLFCDSFINLTTNRETNLSAKPYELTALDKRRVDFFAKAPQVLLGKSQINLTKRYKFRQSTVILEVEIENLSEEVVDNYLYENQINIVLPEGCHINETSQSLNISNNASTISIAFSEDVTIVRNDFEQKTHTWLGDKSFYEYTQFKIQKKLSLGPFEDTRLTIGFRTEKHKEKTNDTSEQSST